jgi:SAM-dependent methyltransferase
VKSTQKNPGGLHSANVLSDHLRSADLDYLNWLKNRLKEPDCTLSPEDSARFPTAYYDLSLRREGLLAWFPFRSTDQVLEVGAGTGALSSLLLKSSAQLTCLELEIDRAKCIEARFDGSKQLRQPKIVVGSPYKLPKSTFDSIVMIDVGRVIHGLERLGQDTGLTTLISWCYERLNPEGSLLLACDNALGLKHWAGVADRQTGRYFDAIEGYPSSSVRYSFSYQEILSPIIGASFESIQCYYPVPDMIEPAEIYSQTYLPNMKHGINPMSISPDVHGQNRVNVFDEHAAISTIVRADQFAEFANSFLVVARKPS